MTEAKALKNCTPAEIQSFVAIVRLAAELKEKEMLDEPAEDMFHAIFQTVNLVYAASDFIEDHGEEGNGNN